MKNFITLVFFVFMACLFGLGVGNAMDREAQFEEERVANHLAETEHKGAY